MRLSEDIITSLRGYLDERESFALCAVSGHKLAAISLTEAASVRYIEDPSFRLSVDDCLQTPGVGLTPHPALQTRRRLALGRHPGKADLALLRWVPNLDDLAVEGSEEVELEGDLSVIAELRNLRSLSLVNVGLTDETLAEIVGHTRQLKDLDVSQNQITSVACLAGLRELRGVKLNGNPDFGAEGLEELSMLTDLQELEINETAVTIRQSLTRLIHLENLWILSTGAADSEPLRTLHI